MRHSRIVIAMPAAVVLLALECPQPPKPIVIGSPRHALASGDSDSVSVDVGAGGSTTVTFTANGPVVVSPNPVTTGADGKATIVVKPGTVVIDTMVTITGKTAAGDTGSHKVLVSPAVATGVVTPAAQADTVSITPHVRKLPNGLIEWSYRIDCDPGEVFNVVATFAKPVKLDAVPGETLPKADAPAITDKGGSLVFQVALKKAGGAGWHEITILAISDAAVGGSASFAIDVRDVGAKSGKTLTLSSTGPK